MIIMEIVNIPKEEFEKIIMKISIQLENSKLYQRLLEFEENIKNKKFTGKV